MMTTPLSDRCSCSHRTPSHECVCLEKVSSPGDLCPGCACGAHKLISELDFREDPHPF